MTLMWSAAARFDLAASHERGRPQLHRCRGSARRDSPFDFAQGRLGRLSPREQWGSGPFAGEGARATQAKPSRVWIIRSWGCLPYGSPDMMRAQT